MTYPRARKTTATKKPLSGRQSKKAPPTKSAAPGALRASSSAPPSKYRVRIRMYRQGIGDSFLLTFAQGDSAQHLLIDCGVLVGTPNAKQWALDIAANIKEATKTDANPSGQLAAVVGTHPHWDHLSGFLDAEGTFKAFSSIGEVWMGWTEDPKDPAGRAMKAVHGAQLDALRLATVQLAGVTDPVMRDHASAVADVMSFFGPGDLVPAPAAVGGGKTEDAVNALRGLSNSCKYWSPGDVIEPVWLPGVRFYVLGPPRDEKLLGKMLSTKPGDLYSLGRDGGFIAALQATSELVAKQSDDQSPFDSSWLFDRAAAAAYPCEFGAVTARYLAADAAWRTIDNQWLLSGETLALRLDSAINNLSLVLAIEFVASGDVLLFPADAQVGNWLSWQTLSWKTKDAHGQERIVTSKDLLARTLFYKVGHHGSHNATLQEGGLEDMSHPGLTAAIPVNEVFAKGSKRWEMPAAKLYQRLQERTSGRLLRSDGVGPFAIAADAKPTQDSAWDAFAKSVFVDQSARPTPLYVDYYLH